MAGKYVFENQDVHSDIFLITLHGLPPQMQSDGIDLVFRCHFVTTMWNTLRTMKLKRFRMENCILFCFCGRFYILFAELAVGLEVVALPPFVP